MEESIHFLIFLKPSLDVEVCIKLFHESTSVLTVSAGQPRVARLERLGCSMDQIIMCGGEIGSAWNDCSSFTDWQQCINDILGASDCAQCVCDVLEWLGFATC